MPGRNEGGSTISQQLAKLAFLTPERSLTRKLKEALYTLWIEARFDKEEILEIYLNRVYLGSGAYGVDAAARLYFAKPASERGPMPRTIVVSILILRVYKLLLRFRKHIYSTPARPAAG